MATIQRVRDGIKAATAEGDYQEALALAEALRRHYPGDHETTELVGRVHLENERYQEARAAFEAVLEVDPENAPARAALAVVAEEEGNPAEALEQFERALGLDPTNAGVVEEVERLHAQLDRPGPAAVPQADSALARRLLREKSYQEAVSLLEVALQVSPREETAVALARALWFAGRPAEAEAVARTILADHPDCLQALAVAAGVSLSRGDQRALSLLSRAAALNPGNGVARALFQEAGLPFPGMAEQTDVPDIVDESDAAGSPAASIGDEAGALGSWRSDAPAGWAFGRLAATLAEPPDGGVGPPISAVASAAGPGEAERPPSAGPVGAEGVGGGGAFSGRPRMEFEAGPVGERAEKTASAGWRGDAGLHISFAGFYRSRGAVDLALEEYRKALRLDPSTAATVREALLPMAEADPANPGIRWMVGDALAVEGQLRQAVEQYLMVLRGRPRGSG